MMSSQSEARPSTDISQREDGYEYRGGYRQHNIGNLQPANPSHPGRTNGFGAADVTRQRTGSSSGAPTQASNGVSPPNKDARNGRDPNQTQNLPARERSRANGAPSGKSGSRICKKCDQSLTGQFVRALGGTYHLECFLCRDCGQIVASKFFPVDDEETGEGQYPLCEIDYFRRLDLLCYDCGGALRGSYITALDRKYHIEHFTCSVCPTIFGAQDSYYEHEGKVYCHYHYSTQYAQRCNGCQTAILKQFVEIFRNGQNQHWHPECYMIHKFWTVRLAPPAGESNEPVLDENASAETRDRVRTAEDQMEAKVYRIWSVLSTFEESSAACISDMLLHVSNGAYMESVTVAKKFIWHVEILFAATDRLDSLITSERLKPLSYGREAKLLCKKIVAFFNLLSKSKETGVRKLGVTQELLSLVTGLAHYLKLLIRISLQGALKLERERQSIEGLNRFLDDLQDLDSLQFADRSLSLTAGVAELANEQADLCHKCHQPVDDDCAKLDQWRWHKNHLTCDHCGKLVGDDLSNVFWSVQEARVLCRRCHEEGQGEPGDATAFESVSRLQQYVYLLRVALARLLQMLRSGGALPHTSDDPNLTTYDSNEGHRVNRSGQLEPPILRANSRSRSYAGTTSTAVDNSASSYEQTVGEMKRYRSTRMDTQLSTNLKTARASRILDRPEATKTRPGSAGAAGTNRRANGVRIEEDTDPKSNALSNLTFGNADALTLDDIPRIVAAEQAKEQRPNAYKHAGNQLIGSGGRQPKLLSTHQRNVSGGNELEMAGGDAPPQRTNRYFSELSALEYFIVRHVAVLSMEPLLEGHYNLEDLLNLIETRKPTFWGKFGKAFAKNDKQNFTKNDKPKGGKKKGVFGVPLDVLVERDGVESTFGVGPGALRVPGLIDDAISAMRGMDMSVEGVFRKNGNIKGLRELRERLDSKEGEVDLSKESPVQVAALLKKFLRELPDPLMTHKLYRLFITSQKINDEEKRRRVLHLTCCLLPKSHRDSLEVLLSFLVWVSSFSQVDEESGSKMDTHNLATVIAPNILKEKTTATVGMDDSSFLAIEAVNCLIEYNDQMAEVPADLQSILNDSSLFNNSSDITTKEILKRYGDIGRSASRRPLITEASADSPPPCSKDSNGIPPSTKAAAPVITHVDTDPYQTAAWPNDTSVRHVQGQAQGAPMYPSPSNNTPPQHSHEFINSTSPYHRRGGSSESQASNGSLTGHGHGHKHSGWGKHNTPSQTGVPG
ncbi:MAG: hypothetical protein Q9163_005188 [Psora crenata]